MAAWSRHPDFQARWKDLRPALEVLSVDDLYDMADEMEKTLPSLTTRERGIAIAVMERLRDRAFMLEEVGHRPDSTF